MVALGGAWSVMDVHPLNSPFRTVSTWGGVGGGLMFFILALLSLTIFVISFCYSPIFKPTTDSGADRCLQKTNYGKEKEEEQIHSASDIL